MFCFKVLFSFFIWLFVDIFGLVSSSYSSDDCCPIEIFFVMDSSRSIGSDGWETEKEFVNEVITTGVSECSPIGALSFSTVEGDLDELSSFSTDHTTVKNVISSATYLDGNTFTRKAILKALDEFNNNGDPDIENLLVLITDDIPHPPNQTPCNSTSVKDALNAANINVVIVAVGDFNEDSISCLVNDPVNDIIEVPSVEELNDFIEKVTDFTKCQCPTFDYYNCQSTFGYACLECDETCGCSKCTYGYELVYIPDDDCPTYGCEKESCGPAPTPCDIEVDYHGCPKPCDTYPCSCNDDCQFCEYDQCKVNGCNQCEYGYFKKDYNYPCIHCQEFFGYGCMFCQDFNGCGQCKTGYQRVYNHYCGLYECQ